MDICTYMWDVDVDVEMSEREEKKDTMAPFMSSHYVM